MMRVRLNAKAPHVLSGSKFEAVPLAVTIRPANNFPGSYEYQTDSRSLLSMLRHKTDVNSLALSQFEQDLRMTREVKLPFVALREEVLEELGYFTE